MEKENIDNLLNDIIKDLDAIKTEDLLSNKKEIKENDIENTIEKLNISSSNPNEEKKDIESIISEIISNNKNQEEGLNNFVDVFSLDEDRENISFKDTTDNLDIYFEEEDTKDLLNQEYIAANSENITFEMDKTNINKKDIKDASKINVQEDVSKINVQEDASKINVQEDASKINAQEDKSKINVQEDTPKINVQEDVSNKEPEYKEVKSKEEQITLKKDIIFEKAYNDILKLVITESKKSSDFLEEENKIYFSKLIDKLESYYKAKDDVFKDIQKIDKSIFDKNI